MVVRIRLARLGRRHLPFYEIVVANARSPRDRKRIETVGTYNPLPDPDGTKQITMDMDRVKYWLSVGAQPTATTGALLAKVGAVQIVFGGWKRMM